MEGESVPDGKDFRPGCNEAPALARGSGAPNSVSIARPSFMRSPWKSEFVTAASHFYHSRNGSSKNPSYQALSPRFDNNDGVFPTATNIMRSYAPTSFTSTSASRLYDGSSGIIKPNFSRLEEDNSHFIRGSTELHTNEVTASLAALRDLQDLQDPLCELHKNPLYSLIGTRRQQTYDRQRNEATSSYLFNGCISSQSLHNTALSYSPMTEDRAIETARAAAVQERAATIAEFRMCHDQATANLAIQMSLVDNLRNNTNRMGLLDQLQASFASQTTRAQETSLKGLDPNCVTSLAAHAPQHVLADQIQSSNSTKQLGTSMLASDDESREYLASTIVRKKPLYATDEIFDRRVKPRIESERKDPHLGHNTGQTETASPALRSPRKISLAVLEDKDSLNKIHSLIRRFFVEAFEATPADVEDRSRGKGNNRVHVGQVGIRCVHCANVPYKKQANQAVAFPSTLNLVFESVRNWQRVHFEACVYIPSDLKNEYRRAKLEGSTKLGPSMQLSRQYYCTSAKNIGLIDTSHGIGFYDTSYSCVTTGIKSNYSLFSKCSAAGGFNGAGFGNPAFGTGCVGELDITTKHILAKAEKEKCVLVLPSDRDIVTDFVFLLYHQLSPFLSSSEVQKDCRDVKHHSDGFVGLRCKHCINCSTSDRKQNNQGKYFPNSPAGLGDSSFTHTLFNHFMKCQRCPNEIKNALLELKATNTHQLGMIKRGMKKIFLSNVWERLHPKVGITLNDSKGSCVPLKENGFKISPKVDVKTVSDFSLIAPGRSRVVVGPTEQDCLAAGLVCGYRYKGDKEESDSAHRNTEKEHNGSKLSLLADSALRNSPGREENVY